MNIINGVGVLALFVGAWLDFLTVYWGFQSARKIEYKSGIFLVPMIMYVVFAFSVDFEFVVNNGMTILIAMVAFHFFVYFLLSWFFDRYFEASEDV